MYLSVSELGFGSACLHGDQCRCRVIVKVLGLLNERSIEEGWEAIL